MKEIKDFSETIRPYGGSTPSEDLAIYQISPGRAFVKGYDVETTAPTFLDVLKPELQKLSNLNKSIIKQEKLLN